MSDEQGSPVPGAADTGSVSERSAQRGAIGTPRTPRQWTHMERGWRDNDGCDTVRDSGGGIWKRSDRDPNLWTKSWRGTFMWLRVLADFGPLSEVLPETPEPPQEGSYFDRTSFADEEAEAARAALAHVPASQSVPAVPVSSTGGKETGEAAETGTEALERDLVDMLRDNPTLFVEDDARVTAGHIVEHFRKAGWQPPATGPFSREQLGEKVREVATAWSLESDDRPGAGLQTWEQLEPDLQEMYMRCGEALFGLGMTCPPVPVREERRNDDWCRVEHCPHRNWQSGSAPTHKIGPGCPEPAPASREEPLSDSETERPRRCPALTPESDLITAGRQCQQYEGHAHDHAWYGDNGHAYSTWRVTS